MRSRDLMAALHAVPPVRLVTWAARADTPPDVVATLNRIADPATPKHEQDAMIGALAKRMRRAERNLARRA